MGKLNKLRISKDKSQISNVHKILREFNISNSNLQVQLDGLLSKVDLYKKVREY